MLHTFSASNDFLSPFSFQFRVLATSNFQNIYFFGVKIVANASFSLFEHSMSLNIFRKQIRTNNPFPVQGDGNICGHQGVQNPSPTISYIVSANSTQIAYLQSTIIVTRILSENDLERYSRQWKPCWFKN
jgi:hypothetical protein